MDVFPNCVDILLIDETEVFSMFMSFIAMANKQYSQTIKVLQSDNGTEFARLRDYFVTTGVVFFQCSSLHTPQQIGKVEHKHQHILNVGRALRFQSHLPNYFWLEFVIVEAHLIYHTPTRLLPNKNPFECLTGKPPSCDAIKVCWFLCFSHNHKIHGDKFAKRSRNTFLWISFRCRKGWRLFYLEMKEIFILGM